MIVLIRAAKIVDPNSKYHNKIADILIENGIIKAIENRLEALLILKLLIKGLHIALDSLIYMLTLEIRSRMERRYRNRY